jgi:phage gp45-like
MNRIARQGVIAGAKGNSQATFSGSSAVLGSFRCV